MGICELLTLIFVVGKVMGIGAMASWSWFQCFLPLSIAVGFYISLLIIAVLNTK